MDCMKRYDEEILRILLDKYENSLLYMSENKRNQTICFLIKKSTIPEYFDESSRQYEVIHEQLLGLSERGLVKLCWKGNKAGHILKKCILVTEQADDVYELLHRLPKKQKEKTVMEFCRSFQGRNIVLDRFLQYIAGRLEQGERVGQYVDLDRPQKFRELCQLVLQILENDREMFLREFSVLYRNDSKAVEKEIAGAAGIIARFSGDGDLNGLSAWQVLEEYLIYKNPSWVMLKGYGHFHCKKDEALCGNGRSVCLEDWPGGIGISSRDIGQVGWDPAIVPKQVITIENLTSFHRWQEEGTLVIYLGGYHNRIKRHFLQQIYKAFPDAGYAHFGDLDCGGFLIWKDLCEKTGIPFVTRDMDVETYLGHLKYGRALTDHDKTELRRLMQEPFFRDQRRVFALMLEKNLKIEQECVGRIYGCID